MNADVWAGRSGRTRLPEANRRADLLDRAMLIAEANGFENVTRERLALAAGVSTALISRYWSALGLQTAIVQEAVATNRLLILAQGLAAGHPDARAASYESRLAAASLLVGEP